MNFHADYPRHITLVSAAKRPVVELSAHQLELLTWSGEGKSAPDIGIILGISSRTVEKRFARICKLLGVRTRIQAVLKARDLGLLGIGVGRLTPARG
jgi:DNA-binding CsgD family transcriptional regulator